jgi:hypothetical protein
MAIHPFHHDIDSRQDDPVKPIKLVTFDESIKTGYTLSSFEAYVKRYYHPETQISTYTLFDFNFERVHGLRSKINSLFVKEKHGADLSLNRRISSGAEHFVSLSWEISADSIIQAKVIDLIKNNNRIDLIFLLCNTPFILSLCRKFANDIEHYIKNDRNVPILLFSPSKEGRVLMLITSLLLNLDGFKIKLTEKSLREFIYKEGFFRVSIDLSMTTGFVFAKSLANSLNYPLVWHSSPDRTKEVALVGGYNRAESYFDLVLNAWPIEDDNTA